MITNDTNTTTNLTLTLPPEMERKLRAGAAASGQDVATFALQAIQEKLQTTPLWPCLLPFLPFMVSSAGTSSAAGSISSTEAGADGSASGICPGDCSAGSCAWGSFDPAFLLKQRLPTPFFLHTTREAGSLSRLWRSPYSFMKPWSDDGGHRS
jgi:hypothetical protein